MEPTPRGAACDIKLNELEGKCMAVREGTDKFRKEVMSRNSKPNNKVGSKVTKTTASTTKHQEDLQMKKDSSQLNSDSTFKKIIPPTCEHNTELLFCRSTKKKLSSPVSSVNTVKKSMSTTSKQHEDLQTKKHSSLVNSDSIPATWEYNEDLQKMKLSLSVNSVNKVKKSTELISKQSVVQLTRTSSFDMEENLNYVIEKEPVTHREMVLLRKPDQLWKKITTRRIKSFTTWKCRFVNRKIGEMPNNEYPLTTKLSVPYKMERVWEYHRGTITASQDELRNPSKFSKHKREKVRIKPFNALFKPKKIKRARINQPKNKRSACEVGKTIPSKSKRHKDLQKKEHSTLVQPDSTDVKRIPSTLEHNIVSPPLSPVNTVKKVIPSTPKQNVVQPTTSSSFNTEVILNQEKLKTQNSNSCEKKRIPHELVMIEQLKTVWKEIMAEKNKSESISEQHEDLQNKKKSSLVKSGDKVSKGIPSRCDHNVDPQKKTLPSPVNFVNIGKKSMLSTSKQHEDLQKKSYSSLLNSNSKVPKGMPSTCENNVDPQEKKHSSPVNSKNKNDLEKKSSFDIEKNWNYEEVKKRFPDLNVRNRTKRQLAMITQLDYFIEKIMGKKIEPYNFKRSKVLSAKTKASRSNRATCKVETKASRSNRPTCKVETNESTSKLHEDLQDETHSSSLSSKSSIHERLPSSCNQNVSLLKMKTWSKGPVIPVVKPIQKKYKKINEPEEKPPPPIVESNYNKGRFPYLKYSRIRKREFVKRVVLTPSTYEGVFCETVEFGCLPRPNSKAKFFAELEGYRNPNPWRY